MLLTADENDAGGKSSLKKTGLRVRDSPLILSRYRRYASPARHGLQELDRFEDFIEARKY